MTTLRLAPFLRTIVGAALLGAAVSAFIACSGDDGGALPPAGAQCSGDLTSIQQVIFRPSCATNGCHAGAAPAGDLDLSGDTAPLLVGVPSALCQGATRVVPGVPSESLLYRKIVGDSTCGSPMPIGSKLSAEQRACIEDWILGLMSAPPSDAGADASCETCGGGACVDLQTDVLHCGACGTACPSGSVCANGACLCSGGQEACGAACVDKSSDPMNCGACGNVCPPNKVCALGSCAMGCGALTQCGASCVDTQTSATDCGMCGNACPPGASCVAGACSCPAGTSACGGACINTATDANNCGACGVVCAGDPCINGSCGCAAGSSLCGGACIDTQSDVKNCGACGNGCAPGQTCSAGACACGAANVSFSAAVQPILTMRCATNGCHAGVMPAQGLNLNAANAYNKLVNVAASECADGRKRVLPGQPSTSYLMDKLLGVDLCFGTVMPKMGMIPAAEIQTISDWICEGAPNN